MVMLLVKRRFLIVHFMLWRTKKVNVEIFERIIKLLNYEIQEIKIGEKK